MKVAGPIGDNVALVQSTVLLTHTRPDGVEVPREHMHNIQIQAPVDALVTGAGPVVTVERGRTERISHAEYYGSGTWDKIPFTVEVHASVTLQCDQTAEKMMQAHGMADDICAAEEPQMRRVRANGGQP